MFHLLPFFSRTFFKTSKSTAIGTEGGEAVNVADICCVRLSDIMEKKWYAVYTKPRWEKKVADALCKIEVENYCPLNKVEKKWSDRKKIVEEPLFTSYVFIRIDARQQIPVREVDGVLNLVYWLGKPAVIKDEEIDLIKRFLNQHKRFRLEKNRVLVNDRVKIVSGPLMEMEGEVLSVNSKTVRVKLPSLGYFLAAEVEIDNLRISQNV